MHLSVAIRREGGTTFTNPPYPKPRLFNKKLLTPLPWGQRSVLCQVKRCNICYNSICYNYTYELIKHKQRKLFHLFSIHDEVQLTFQVMEWERREYSCFLEMEALGFLEYILECFVNIYRYLKILWVFLRGSCYESAIQSPHPWLKVIEPSWQIPSHARVCPWGYPPLISAFGRNYVIITRIKKKKKTLQIHFEFSYFFSFLFIWKRSSVP